MTDELAFKYVIQDFSNVYIGARLSYEELTLLDDTPQRLKSALFRSMLDDEKKKQRICDRLLKLEEGSAEYMMYLQLKMQIRIVKPVVRVDRKGKQHVEYKTTSYAFEDFMKMRGTKEAVSAQQISELTFKKLHLMSLAV